MPYPNSAAVRRARLRRLTRIAVFLSLSLVLHLVESTILPPLPIPGAKLGLANLATLVLLHLEGPGPAFAVAFGRVVLGSLFGGTFLGIAFWPTMAGALAATAAMTLTRRVSALGTVGISVSGALAHNLGQLAAIYPLFPNAGFVYFLPFLILLAIPAGIFNGVVGDRVLSAMGYKVKKPKGARETGPSEDTPS